jgi:hypothetical protein
MFETIAQLIVCIIALFCVPMLTRKLVSELGMGVGQEIMSKGLWASKFFGVTGALASAKGMAFSAVGRGAFAAGSSVGKLARREASAGLFLTAKGLSKAASSSPMGFADKAMKSVVAMNNLMARQGRYGAPIEKKSDGITPAHYDFQSGEHLSKGVIRSGASQLSKAISPERKSSQIGSSGFVSSQGVWSSAPLGDHKSGMWSKDKAFQKAYEGYAQNLSTKKSRPLPFSKEEAFRATKISDQFQMTPQGMTIGGGKSRTSLSSVPKSPVILNDWLRRPQGKGYDAELTRVRSFLETSSTRTSGPNDNPIDSAQRSEIKRSKPKSKTPKGTPTV